MCACACTRTCVHTHTHTHTHPYLGVWSPGLTNGKPQNLVFSSFAFPCSTLERIRDRPSLGTQQQVRGQTLSHPAAGL